MKNYGVDRDGFCITENFLPEAEVSNLIEFVNRNLAVDDRRGGLRNLLDLPRIRELAQSELMCGAAAAILNGEARVVRGILFDKTESANWKVPWHQDVTIAVKNKVETPGYGPWSVKAGILHVQPPAKILECMISLRLHLDDCPEENGALRVIPGSHVHGKLQERTIQQIAERSNAVVCEMMRGGLLLMRPLLLHASSASSLPGHRRVIHFDYAAAEIPASMEWSTQA